MEPLRVGVLGAARISELSIIGPAAATGTRLVAVAARDRGRAEAFASTHGVERVLDSYADVVDDPEVEAVYNPLANSLHAPWNKAAILAGKHVLTEKPFASNTAEAAQVRDLARGRSLVLFEGFHYLYHPLMKRLMSLLAGGELGTLRRVESTMLMSAPDASDPRWSLDLAGGALMDLGCYALHAQRVLGDFAGGEPTLVDAMGAEGDGFPGVDAWADAYLEFPSGATGLARCSMTSDHWDMSLRVVGSAGEAYIPDFLYQKYDDRIIVRTGAGERTEHCGDATSYTYQLEAFVDAVRQGAPYRTGADDAVATMALIDSCYRSIGLQPRPSYAGQLITSTPGGTTP
ncbi:MAG: oxidoreductase domain protein [Marmoricola sp.]|jgi:predicted dehydrogenase|nr:oxidoreductase domain protein [Marmoricola sp.]